MLRIIATLVAVSVATTTACPTNYVEMYLDEAHSLPPTCIRFYDSVKGSWEEMRNLCKLDNTDLARPTGNLFAEIHNYIMDHEYLKDDGFWIGGYYDAGSSKWLWTDGSEMPPDGQYPWYYDQPDQVSHSHNACIYTPDHLMHSCGDQRIINAICQT